MAKSQNNSKNNKKSKENNPHYCVFCKQIVPRSEPCFTKKESKECVKQVRSKKQKQKSEPVMADKLPDTNSKQHIMVLEPRLTDNQVVTLLTLLKGVEAISGILGTPNHNLREIYNKLDDYDLDGAGLKPEDNLDSLAVLEELKRLLSSKGKKKVKKVFELVEEIVQESKSNMTKVKELVKSAVSIMPEMTEIEKKAFEEFLKD